MRSMSGMSRKRKNVRQVRAGNRRHDRLGALAQNKFVIGHVTLRAVWAFDPHSFGGTVDGQDFMVDMRVNARSAPKTFPAS